MAEDKELAPEVIEQFKTHFKLVWKELSMHGRNATRELPTYQESQNFCEQHSIPVHWLEAILVDKTNDTDQVEFYLSILAANPFKGLSGHFSFIRGILCNLSKKYDEAISSLTDAAESSDFTTPGIAYRRIGNSLLNQKKYDEAIEAYQKALDLHENDDPGIVWNNMGYALSCQKKYDEAIKAYQKAINSPNYYNQGGTWHNTGLTLSDQNKYDEAIDAYQKALDSPNYDIPGMTWHSMGNALSCQKKYDEAIEAYQRALDSPKYDDPGGTWNNMGLTLSDQNKYDEAIEAYQRAMDSPNYDTPGMAWNNMGIALSDQKKYGEAIEAYQKAMECTDPSDGQHQKAKMLIDIAESGLSKSALSEKDRSIAEVNPDLTKGLPIERRIHSKILESGDTQYDKYAEINQNHQGGDKLSILRGWCSSVTLLEGSEGRWLGGGYFLQWRKKGIVIDPGFDFLRNFHDRDFHARDIDAVFVSHNHPDHNQDLKPIDDLRYELYKRLHNDAEEPLAPYSLVWDQDTSLNTKFGVEQPEHHFEPITCTTGYPQTIDLSGEPWNLPFKITPFKVEHTSDVPHALGAVIELIGENNETELRIGYTADTAYFEELPKHLSDCDVIIAHISQPTLEEITDETESHSGHLGYRGTIRLLKEAKPKLALIGEFWAGFTDLRVDLTNALRQQVGVKAILPAGIGLDITIPDMNVLCSDCEKPIAPGQIKIAPPAAHSPFGNLSYLCEDCMI